EITLVDETQGRYGDDIMFDVSDLAVEEVFVAEQGVPDSKKDDIVSTAGDAAQVIVQDKGKGKMIEPEPVKKFSKKDQLNLDEEVAQREKKKTRCSKKRRRKGEQTTNQSLTKEYHVYLSEKHGRKEETDEVDEDKETAELQILMQVIPDKEEVAIDAIPLATKPPSIVD
ncbi:hypothetical protein Tco_1560422, partial [Tanacetum coccineum]